MFDFKSAEELEIESLKHLVSDLQAENKKLRQTSTLLDQLNPILEKAATNDTYYQALAQYVAEVTYQLNSVQDIDVFVVKEYLEALLKGSTVEVFIGMELYNSLYRGYHEKGKMNVEHEINTEDFLDLYDLRTNEEFDLNSLLSQVHNKQGLILLSDVKTKPAKLSQYSTVAVYTLEELLDIAPGFVVFLDKNRITYSPNEKEMIEIFMTLIQPVINSKIVTAQLMREASSAIKASCTDPLTEIYNRGKFMQDYLNNDNNISDILLFMDLNKLKLINDTHGHDIADNVIISLGRHLDEFARSLGGTAYRLGGDEFMAKLPPNLDNREVEIAVEQFADKFQSTTFVNHDGECFKTTVSIGVARNTKPYTTQENMVKLVDELMYKSKHQTHIIEYSWR